MKRVDLLNALRFAGYHDDKTEYVRLYVGNRVARMVAEEAFRSGARARRAGVACTCSKCAHPQQTPDVREEQGRDD